MTDLDITTFNAPNGYVTTNFDAIPTNNSSCICRAIVLQADGKIVMAGDYDDIAISQKKVAVCRYNSNGTLDLSFGGSGTGKIAITIPTYSPNVQGLTLQSDGKIVICGTLYSLFKDIFVLRLTNTGILDTTNFGAPNGYTITPPAQFTSVYAPTLGFDNCEANSITMQTYLGTEYIVIGGTARGQVLSPLGPTTQYYALVRYNLSGSLNTSFTNGGVVAQSFSLTDQVGLAIYADSNKILLAGNNSLPGPPPTTTTHTKMTVVKFSGNGVLDSTWGNQSPTPNGLTEIPNFFTQSYDDANAIALQSNGNIVLGGSSINANLSSQRCFALARLLPTGLIDLGYGTNGNGKVLTNLSPTYNLYGKTMGIQPDDKIVLGGTWDILGTSPTSFALARYLTTGVLDTTFGLAGTGLILEDIDSTINPGGGCVETGYSLAIQPNGKILMGGELNQYLASEGGPTSFMLARYFGFPPFPPPPPPPPPPPHPTPISNICFLAGTCVTTDQGDIPIELIVPDFHTIFNKPIIAITETIMLENKLVCFEKNSLGNNIPNKKTYISNNHVIVYNNKLIQAYRFVGRVRGVYYTKYNSEFLYNILMEKHYVIKVNNLKVETLYPKNFVAHLYTHNYTSQEKRNIILKMNEQAIKMDEQKPKKFDILNYNNVRNTQFTKRCVQKSNFLIATHNNATIRRHPLLGRFVKNDNFNLFTRKSGIVNKKFMMVKSNKRFRR